MTEKRERGPTGKAEDGGDRARGFAGDSGGLSLAIRTSTGGQPRMMQPSRSIGKEESPLGGRIVSGGTRNQHLSREREISRRSEDANSVLGNEVRDASVDEEAGVIDVCMCVCMSVTLK